MKLERGVFLVLIAVALVAVSGEARGDTIYDNGSYGAGLTGGYSDLASIRIAADDFTLSESASISGMQFWGIYWPQGSSQVNDSFTLVFYGDASGKPDNSNVVATFNLGNLSETLVYDSPTAARYDIYSYQAAFSSTTFNAGTYWVSIFNDTTGDTSNSWLWNMTYDNPTWYKAYRDLPSTTWQTYSGSRDYAFNLTGSWGSSPVPEPTTLALLGLGLAGLLLRKRRRS